MDIQFPTPTHAAVLEKTVAGLRDDPTVLGVLLGGSLSRGTARPDSDIDLLVVVTENSSLQRGQRHLDGLLVELGVRTESAWLDQFSPTTVADESWGYAFLDGVVLHDPHGVVARLVTGAAQAHAAYHVPESITAYYAHFWDHARPKMQAVLGAADPTEVGWTAAVMTSHLLQTLWAVSDRPLASLDLGCLHRHLDDVSTPPGAPDLVRELLRSAPAEALHRQLELLDLIMPHLR